MFPWLGWSVCAGSIGCVSRRGGRDTRGDVPFISMMVSGIEQSLDRAEGRDLKWADRLGKRKMDLERIMDVV